MGIARKPRDARSETDSVLSRLGEVCRTRGLDALSERLAGLATLVVPDIERVERELSVLGFRDDSVGRSASHLVRLGGKRLRPLCVALAARVPSDSGGVGVDETRVESGVLDLAVAVELVHNATLLHDDVVDLGDVRRGAPAARVVYGNAASIFAGDWLLVEALRRVRSSGVTRVLDPLLAVIDEMIEAEAVQLEHRGTLDVDRATYFRVIEGKTASLFGWAAYAGGRAAGLGDQSCAALSTFGRKLGIAFQAVDDLLDVSGDARTTGKALFADLREGKATYPLLVAFEREPALRERARALAAATEAGHDVDAACADVRAAMERTGAVAACGELAHRSATDAMAALDVLPACPARSALQTVAEATVHRLW
ncbi:MAG: polyprenyl synthetase family protein [Deltaproteobacteria bacterium]|nr:polyprenyl synthetase family protein [Deltaproteobacteria bacterium]